MAGVRARGLYMHVIIMKAQWPKPNDVSSGCRRGDRDLGRAHFAQAGWCDSIDSAATPLLLIKPSVV